MFTFMNTPPETYNEDVKKIKDVYDQRSKDFFYTFNLRTRTLYYGHIIKDLIRPIFRANFGEDFDHNEYKIFDYGTWDGQKLGKIIDELQLSNPKNEVFACDISDGMIDKARRRFWHRSSKVKKIDIYNNYNMEPDIKYSGIDIFLINQVLHFYTKETKARMLENAYKSMSKGGLLLLLDWYTPPNRHESRDDSKQNIFKVWQRKIFKACVKLYEKATAWKYSHYITVNEMSEILKDIWFTICGVKWYKSLWTWYMFGGIDWTTQIICKK
jgi:SAM-dependent methyltransferase